MQDPEPQPRRLDADPPVERLRTGSARGTWLLVVLAAAAIAVAVIQPWGVILGPPTVDGPSAATGHVAGTERQPLTPAPTDPYAELIVTCGYPSGWRAATLQHWIGRTAPIRTWTAVDPVRASGAGDPRIPYAPIATDLVLAIGYCSPVSPDQPPQGVTVELWSAPDGGSTPRRLAGRRLEPDHENALGGLWLPTGDRTAVVDGTTGWAPGRYAIRISSPGFDRWLGLEIEDISGLRRSPSPSGDT